MNLPRLLFLSHRLPYPPHNGAAIRAFNILKLLARHYEITALCFDRMDPATAGMSLRDRIDALSSLGRFEVFPIPQEHASGRLLWDHLRSVLSRRVYTEFVHQSRPFRAALERQLTDTQFDLIHVDSLDLIAQLDLLPPDRVILTHHNVESLLLARRAAAEQSMARRAYLRMQSELLAKAESAWMPRVALNIAVSAYDEAELRTLAPGARFAVVPNGVDVEYFSPTQRPQRGMAFVGGTSYYPNLDALEWFAAEILPEIRDRGCQAPATFIGRATPAEMARFNKRGLTLSGYVPDIRPALDAAACFIAPLRVGGGTRLKLVDAWAMGKAVVSTTVGAEGLAAEHGQNILLADTAREFADGVISVLNDSDLRVRLERNARHTAESIYSWRVIERDMIAHYEQVRRAAVASRH